MTFEELRQKFEGMTAAERLQALNLMWPELHLELQICVMMTVVAILGFSEAKVLGRLAHYLGHEEDPNVTPQPAKE